MLKAEERHTQQTSSVEELRSWIRTFYEDESIVVLANREPVRHDRAPDGRVLVSRSASGLVTALEPLMHACGGIWVAHGAGSADRRVVDRRDGLDVPPANPSYRLGGSGSSRTKSAVITTGLPTKGCGRCATALMFNRFRSYPVSIEWPNRWASLCPTRQACREEVLGRLGLSSDVRLGVGIDRLDYTKGINEKFLAVERMLEMRPDFQGRFVFVQIAEPSRSCLPAYRELRSRLIDTTDRINRRFGGKGASRSCSSRDTTSPRRYFGS
jgi:trehalose-6-phosphate synthase